MGRPAEGLALIERLGLDTDETTLSLSIRSMIAAMRGDAVSIESMLRLTRQFPDPEGRFEAALWMAGVGRVDHAIDVIAEAVEQDFFVLPAVRRHPWLAHVARHPRYPDVLARAEEGRRKAIRIYQELGGEAFLGVKVEG
jgi:hypothetical protein